MTNTHALTRAHTIFQSIFSPSACDLTVGNIHAYDKFSRHFFSLLCSFLSGVEQKTNPFIALGVTVWLQNLCVFSLLVLMSWIIFAVRFNTTALSLTKFHSSHWNLENYNKMYTHCSNYSYNVAYSVSPQIAMWWNHIFAFLFYLQNRKEKKWKTKIKQNERETQDEWKLLKRKM